MSAWPLFHRKNICLEFFHNGHHVYEVTEVSFSPHKETSCSKTLYQCSRLECCHKLNYCLSLPRFSLAPGQRVLWLKPDCSCPTWNGPQKNRLQWCILPTRGGQLHKWTAAPLSSEWVYFQVRPSTFVIHYYLLIVAHCLRITSTHVQVLLNSLKALSEA